MFMRPSSHRRRMAGDPSDPALQVVFGKAFLLELHRGNMDRARLFARAFLAHSAPERFIAAAGVP
jgi:hypothetical protein